MNIRQITPTAKEIEVHKESGYSILIIDDEENMRHMLEKMLTMEGYGVKTAGDGREGLAAIQKDLFDVILCDMKMPGMDGLAFLAEAHNCAGSATIIMMSAYGTIDSAVEAMKLGAYDFISKPFKSDEIILVIKKALERDFLKRENLILKEKIRSIEGRYSFGRLISKSNAMKAIFELAGKAAPYGTTVLITGESGTGKELVARALHEAGPRSKQALVPVNCGGIPENLLESELFGYVKGAFTGADHSKKGLFEEAHGGTLFLDEIGELPFALQVKLLRVLQENEIRPVGSAHVKKIDVRVVAATSRDLSSMVEKGAFREDLFYRLNVLPIHIPPLRDRLEDVPLLCQHFFRRFNQALGRNVKAVAPSAMSCLLEYHWPGNVRELENIIERAMVLSDADSISVEHLPEAIVSRGLKNEKGSNFNGYSLKQAQKAMEKDLITRALKATEGNRTQASKLLEISHPSLLNKLKLYGIDL